MTRGVNRLGGNSADLIAVTVGEQLIKLAAIPFKLGAGVKNFAKHILHRHNMFGNANLATKLLLNIGRCRQMIGMNMRFNQPFQIKAPGFNLGNHCIGMLITHGAGRIIKIEHRIDNRRLIGRRIDNQIADSIAVIVKKTFNIRCL